MASSSRSTAKPGSAAPISVTPEQILDASGDTLQKKFNIKPAQRSPQEYVRDLRIQRGLPVREQHEKPAEAADYGRAGDAYGDASSLEARRERVRAMRAARGFAPQH